MPARLATVRLSAAGFSDWIRINYMTSGFGVGFGVKMSSNGNLTYSVQHTFDDLYEKTQVFLSRTTTSLTVKKTNHGLSTGDWVNLTAAPVAAWNTTYSVASVTDQNNFVVTVLDTGLSAGVGFLQSARVFDHPDIDDETASADGNYQFPCSAIRLIVTSFTAGYVDLNVWQAGK